MELPLLFAGCALAVSRLLWSRAHKKPRLLFYARNVVETEAEDRFSEECRKMFLEFLRKAQRKCPECFMSRPTCICPGLLHAQLKRKMMMVIHSGEFRKFSCTNTAVKLVCSCPDAQVFAFGAAGEKPRLHRSLSEYEPHQVVVLYPQADSITCDDLSPGELEEIKCIVVIDGTWSQAKSVNSGIPKMYRRIRLRDTVEQADFGISLRKNENKFHVNTFSATLQLLREFKESPKTLAILEHNLHFLQKAVLDQFPAIKRDSLLRQAEKWA